MESLEHDVRITAVPAVMAGGRPACCGAQRGSRDGLPAFTGRTPVIRFIQRFLQLDADFFEAFSDFLFERRRVASVEKDAQFFNAESLVTLGCREGDVARP